MNADEIMQKIFEYSSTINNCCAFVKECVYTGKCLVDEGIVGCSQRNDFKKVKEALDAKPVRHGKWIMKKDPYGYFDEIPVCSECGTTTKLRETYKYCPYCGAKMDERKEE